MHKSTVTRTIKNGMVKIYGIYYEPNDHWKKYDGSLDNKKYTFYIYGNDIDFIFMYDCPEDGGFYNWEFWHPITDHSADAIHLLERLH